MNGQKILCKDVHNMTCILVLNCGSSSIKFTVFTKESYKPIATGLIEGIGSELGRVRIESSINNLDKEFPNISYQEGLCLINQWLQKSQEVTGEILGVGHRVVHGGSFFHSPKKVCNTVLEKIRELLVLAPLHNKVNLEGIEFFNEKYKDKQVAVFDTAFHQSIPPVAHLYGIQQKYCTKFGIRRYGFHGTSHQFVASQMAKELHKPLDECSMITLHLGNGCSACAIRDGQSIDTSMGFTPLEGLVMGTRSGTLDPSILSFLCEKQGLTHQNVLEIFNKRSGLLGVSGISHDMRELESLYTKDERAKLAIDMFCYHVVKTVGSYVPLLDNLEALVFTGGIGENSPFIRQKILSRLEVFGFICDTEKNSIKGQRLITKNSKPGAYVIKTNEELNIAKQVARILL